MRFVACESRIKPGRRMLEGYDDRAFAARGVSLEAHVGCDLNVLLDHHSVPAKQAVPQGNTMSFLASAGCSAPKRTSSRCAASWRKGA